MTLRYRCHSEGCGGLPTCVGILSRLTLTVSEGSTQVGIFPFFMPTYKKLLDIWYYVCEYGFYMLRVVS